MDCLAPEFEKQGFIYQKGGRFWRICDNKTDVIELRFLLNNDSLSSNLPLSTFSLLGGCYLNFLPKVFGDKALHHLPNLLTPDETHCNLRFTAVRSIHQHILKRNSYSWHLDCDENEQSEILTDVRNAFGTQFLPLMNKFNDINKLLNLLESRNSLEVDMGIGKPDSFNRHYLLGFIYLKLQRIDLAAQHLNQAKKLLDELLVKVAEPMSLKSDSPLLRQSENIINALSALKSTQ